MKKPELTICSYDTEESNEGYGMKYRVDFWFKCKSENKKEARDFIRELLEFLDE